MPDYSNGKIYAIKSNETVNVYIGSTCDALKKRFSSHMSNYKRSLLGVKFRDSCSGKILKFTDARIELIENFPCETKRGLLDREGEIIRNTPNCVNTQIQGRTMEQYREDNADKLKQQSKDYREKNKSVLNQKYSEWYKSEGGKAYHEKIKTKRNEKVICTVCGKESGRSNLTRHMKTHA